MFISVDLASVRIQLSLLAPQFFTWRRLNPYRNGDCLAGMTELASNCGDTNVDLTNCSVRSELGFDVLSGMFFPPNPVRHKSCEIVQNVPHKKQDRKDPQKLTWSA